MLLIACGFIGGVLVEKGQSSLELLRRRRRREPRVALRAPCAGAHRAPARARGRAARRLGAGGSGARASRGRPPGTVAYLAGSTLYVTNSEGNTVKVTTSPGTSVTKTVKASVSGIHPAKP